MSHSKAVKVAGIVRDAGGRVIGRTRLQKTAYLLHAAGLEEGMRFVYKHYGPYSEDMAEAALSAGLLGLLNELETPTSWGGMYSTYTVDDAPDGTSAQARIQLIEIANQADAIELELAATALFLAKEGVRDPWTETARRKPEKAENGRLDGAKRLYRRLSEIDAPQAWPKLA